MKGFCSLKWQWKETLSKCNRRRKSGRGRGRRGKYAKTRCKWNCNWRGIKHHRDNCHGKKKKQKKKDKSKTKSRVQVSELFVVQRNCKEHILEAHSVCKPPSQQCFLE